MTGNGIRTIQFWTLVLHVPTSHAPDNPPFLLNLEIAKTKTKCLVKSYNSVDSDWLEKV